MILCFHIDTTCTSANLREGDHTNIFQTTKSASDKWRAIGRELGFTADQLDAITHETGRHYKEDFYEAMLRRWLDWAPPNHSHPTIQNLSSSLRAVGKERQAWDLDVKYYVHSK